MPTQTLINPLFYVNKLIYKTILGDVSLIYIILFFLVKQVLNYFRSCIKTFYLLEPAETLCAQKQRHIRAHICKYSLTLCTHVYK